MPMETQKGRNKIPFEIKLQDLVIHPYTDGLIARQPRKIERQYSQSLVERWTHLQKKKCSWENQIAEEVCSVFFYWCECLSWSQQAVTYFKAGR